MYKLGVICHRLGKNGDTDFLCILVCQAGCFQFCIYNYSDIIIKIQAEGYGRRYKIMLLLCKKCAEIIT